VSSKSKKQTTNTDRDFTTATDANGTVWRFRLGFNTIRKILRELNITLAELTVMEVRFADLLDCLHIVCEAQAKEIGLGKEEFYNRIETVPLTELTHALRGCVALAFPSASEQLAGGDGGTATETPFAHGK